MKSEDANVHIDGDGKAQLWLVPNAYMDWIRTIIELISLLGRLKNSDYKYLCEIDGNCCTRN